VKFVLRREELTAIQAIEKFADRLPEGDVEGHIRRSAHELTLAVEQRRGLEARAEARRLSGLKIPDTMIPLPE
jgi:hypothetical protein